MVYADVLHFHKTYYPDSYGGIEQVIFQRCADAATYGIDFTVLALARVVTLNPSRWSNIIPPTAPSILNLPRRRFYLVLSRGFAS